MIINFLIELTTYASIFFFGGLAVFIVVFALDWTPENDKPKRKPLTYEEMELAYWHLQEKRKRELKRKENRITPEDLEIIQDYYLQKALRDMKRKQED